MLPRWGALLDILNAILPLYFPQNSGPVWTSGPGLRRHAPPFAPDLSPLFPTDIRHIDSRAYRWEPAFLLGQHSLSCFWCDITPDSWLALMQMVQSQYFSPGIYGATQPGPYEGTMQPGMMMPPVILPQPMQHMMVPTQV